MKKRWKRRGLAVLTVVTLILAAAGIAEAPEAADEIESPICAEAVDPAVALGELELGDDLTIDEAAVPATDPEPAPEAVENPEEESAPEAAENPEEEPAPEAVENPEEEPAPEAAEKPEEQPAPEAEPEGEAEAEAAPEAAQVIETEAAAVANYEAEVPETLTFPAATLKMGKGERRQVVPAMSESVDPAQVTYVSSKPSVVKAEAGGSLYARKKGTAKITATTAGGVSATCEVKVVKAPSRVRLSAKALTIGLEEARALKVKLPSGSASAITWTSGDPAVATVDEAGNVLGVGPGTTRITARTFNGKQARCTVTVLNGRAPTALTFPSKTVSLGLREQLQLAPQLGEGEAALFTYASSNKRVVSVTRGGLLTAKKKGTVKITVKTHNGLKYRLTVKVTKAPGKVTLSKVNIALAVGASTVLKAKLPSGTASVITWSSSDENVASVDAAGNVLALNPGTATITAATFNGKSASCSVTVTPPPSPDEIEKQTPPSLTNAQMAANLRAYSALGGKREAIANVALLLMNNGFEPSFAAGVCANIYSEGNYGFFESSEYIKNYQKRPSYFCYLDGGDYYTLQNGQYVLTAVYLSQEDYNNYTGTAEKRLRFGEEKYYWNNWSGKYIYEVDLQAFKAFSDLLNQEKFKKGKFGLGITQWTGGRTRNLLRLYLKHAGENSTTITKEQVIAAENEMILYDLQGDYKKVYTGWRNENKNALYCPEAARSAGSWVCLKYEIPANKETSAVKRGNNAAKFYQVMVGTN